MMGETKSPLLIQHPLLGPQSFLLPMGLAQLLRGNFLLQGFFGNLEASLTHLEAALGQQEGNGLFLAGN